jgi:hypothetical protein
MWISDRRRNGRAISRRYETTDDPYIPRNHGVFNMNAALVDGIFDSGVVRLCQPFRHLEIPLSSAFGTTSRKIAGSFYIFVD